MRFLERNRDKRARANNDHPAAERPDPERAVRRLLLSILTGMFTTTSLA